MQVQSIVEIKWGFALNRYSFPRRSSSYKVTGGQNRVLPTNFSNNSVAHIFSRVFMGIALSLSTPRESEACASLLLPVRKIYRIKYRCEGFRDSVSAVWQYIFVHVYGLSDGALECCHLCRQCVRPALTDWSYKKD